jgi:biopolymer transport protein ExbD
MTRRRTDSELRPVANINVTPLMDLTFLLLIVFMITAPVLEFATDVSPPEMSTDKTVEDDREPVMVGLDKQGRLLLRKQRIDTPGELTRRLEELRLQHPELTVLIRADGGRPYREVITLMKAVRAANITNISLVTQPES